LTGVVLSEFLAWQALLARQKGDEVQARRCCRMATARMGHLQMPPFGAYYDALCDYHERGGKLASALRLRDRELKVIAGMGRFHYESRCRLKRCRLLAQLGKALDGELAATRDVILKLRRPERYLEELEEVVRRQPPGARGV